MTEIKYKLVDGEPVCLGDECPSFGKKETGVSFIHYRNCKITGLNFNEIDLPHDGYKDVMEGHPCIPGLRQQRDEARAVIEQVREAQIHESVSGEALYCCSRCTRKILRGERFMIVGKAAVCVECFFRALLPAPATNDGYKHCKICGGKMCLDEDTWLCRGCPQTPAPATPEALRELTPEEAATCPKLTDEQIREALNKGWDESGFGDPVPATEGGEE